MAFLSGLLEKGTWCLKTVQRTCGKLNFITNRILRVGRCFLWRCYDEMPRLRALGEHTEAPISEGARRDLKLRVPGRGTQSSFFDVQHGRGTETAFFKFSIHVFSSDRGPLWPWWLTFLPQWNGHSTMRRSTDCAGPDRQVFTDAMKEENADGKVFAACGGFWRDRWFYFEFPPSDHHQHITWIRLPRRMEARALAEVSRRYDCNIHVGFQLAERLRLLRTDGPLNTDAKVVSDGLGAIRSHSKPLREEYRQILMQLTLLDVAVETEHFPGDQNEIAEPSVYSCRPRVHTVVCNFQNGVETGEVRQDSAPPGPTTYTTDPGRAGFIEGL